MMIAFSGGNIVLALILVLLASLILGMGLPVTAAYIVLIILVGPALTSEFGVPILIAHLVVFGIRKTVTSRRPWRSPPLPGPRLRGQNRWKPASNRGNLPKGSI
jgi:hypothetical protein